MDGEMIEFIEDTIQNTKNYINAFLMIQKIDYEIFDIVFYGGVKWIWM